MALKMIAIPQDANDIQDLAVFKDAIKEINRFNKNLSKFGKKIFEDKYCKTLEEWKKILTDKDWKNNFEDKSDTRSFYDRTIHENKTITIKGEKYDPKRQANDLYIFDYKNKKLICYKLGYRHGWSMGESTAQKSKFSFSDDGNILIVKQTWSSRKDRLFAKWEHHTNTYRIDIVSDEVETRSSL